MLSCHECEKYLPLFLDQALVVKESLDVHEHLYTCTACAERADAEQTFRTFFRQHVGISPPPDHVKQRIVRRAMQPGPRLRWLGQWVPIGSLRDFTIGMGTAAAIVLFVFELMAPGDDLIQKFTREARLAYKTYTGQNMPLEVYAQDDSQMQEWFNTQMGYPVSLRGMVDGTTQLLGGRLCRLIDRKGVALKYHHKGVDLFLFAFQGDQLPPPKTGTFHVRHAAGRPPVAMWQRAGITYSLVGDLNRDDFMQMASTVSAR